MLIFTVQFEAQYAVDDRLNGVGARLQASNIKPGSPIPTDILPRVWPV